MSMWAPNSVPIVSRNRHFELLLIVRTRKKQMVDMYANTVDVDRWFCNENQCDTTRNDRCHARTFFSWASA